ncbi:MAG TPA: aldolase/citrate lyase family protein [Pseudorhodoplanes sp.]|nr:aldolase/citrate lyase family protein [Pseudorhodoplanes sp.]
MSEGKKLTIREKLNAGPTFGMTMYTGSSATVEIAGNWGIDFAFIDAEHTAVNIDEHMEKLILSAKLAGISPLVRIRGTNEWDIRKTLELGADGVIVPQVNTVEQARAIINAAKFPPLGRRGGDASCRAAGFGGPNFKWSDYMERQNREPLIIPMAEGYGFFDSIDAILDVEGLDVINFGPADYSISRQIPIDYSMSNPEVTDKLNELIAKCRKRNLKVMAPCIPPTAENAAKLAKQGVDMIIMGNDVLFLNQGCRGVADAMKAVRG